MCTTSSWSNHGDDGDHVGLGFLTPPTYHKVANNKHWQTTINRQTFGLFCVFLLHCKSNGPGRKQAKRYCFPIGRHAREEFSFSSQKKKPPICASRSRSRWPRALVQVATEDTDKGSRPSQEHSRCWLRWTPWIYVRICMWWPRPTSLCCWLKSNRSLNLGDAHITPVRWCFLN